MNENIHNTHYVCICVERIVRCLFTVHDNKIVDHRLICPLNITINSVQDRIGLFECFELVKRHFEPSASGLWVIVLSITVPARQLQMLQLPFVPHFHCNWYSETRWNYICYVPLCSQITYESNAKIYLLFYVVRYEIGFLSLCGLRTKFSKLMVLETNGHTFYVN